MKKKSMDLTASIKRLSIETIKLVDTSMVGNYRSVFKGKGLEFMDYRQYSQDDDASMIDWKASVRSKSLLVREFAEERNLNVFFLIDVSSSMIFSTIDKLKIEYAAELVATLGYTILKAGDSISFALFNDKVIKHSPPGSGMKQYSHLIGTLVDAQHYGGNYDLSEALKFAMSFLKEFSIVIIVSDFIGLKDDWQHYLKIMGKKFDLVGIMINDPVEHDLPDYSGRVVLGDAFSDRQLLISVDSVREPYRRYAESHAKELSEAFIGANADFLRLRTDKPFVKPLIDLFLKRARRRR